MAAVAILALTPAPGAAASGPWSANPAVARSAGPPQGRVGVGDSIMVGAATMMRSNGFRVNGKVGRQFRRAPGILRSYGSALPRNVVLELGTNGTVRMSDCLAVLQIAGPKRRVFFVNNRMPRSWQDPNNAALAACAATAPDRAWVIDWYTASTDAWDWFAPDSVHLTRSGSVALANLIDTTVDQLGR